MERLHWRAEVPVIPAVASEGRGVLETFQQAARAATRYTQSIITMRGLPAIVGRPKNADSVFDDLLALEDQLDSGTDSLADPDMTDLEAEEQLEAVVA